ncbi:Peptidase family M23 [Gimesia panareensis]|uniref:Peptidase family M23 n=1 Tax=Gimesia panareensis TaxID=2527978 RepID=A0A517PZS6_9PLAN|nr:PKD domain-containing protein [Gimesia panareensis]QDT24884.1 Peptidase family M23 [Gimesia panareensis]
MLKSSLHALVCVLLIALCCSLSALPARADENKPALDPIVRVVDLNVGETTTVTLSNGEQVKVKLCDLKETRDPIRNAVRSAIVTVEVDGETIELESGMYNLPQSIGKVQVDCSITSGYNSNGTPSFWGLDKDARLRFWPNGSPLLKPGSFIYPVEQRWFATRTWYDNEPVDGGTKILPKIYYHSGLDIGGAEKLTRVIAATDAIVVSSGTDVLDGHKQDTPIAQRYDVVYLLDARGWYYRYSHLHKINDSIRPGRLIKQGEEIGILGKRGASGGWSHLHFEIKSRQPSGKWGTQAGYAFIWEAYRNQYDPKLVANTRRKHMVLPGDRVILSGLQSYSVNYSIVDFEWIFSDGTTTRGPAIERKYDSPGIYCETLKVTDVEGNVDYDFAEVQVLDPNHPEEYVPRLHASYWPSLKNKVGDPITFKVRSFGNTYGKEVWDFGDGSPTVSVKSDGNVKPLNEDGYAITQHTYQKPGDYLVKVERSREDGVKAETRLHVRVEP